MDVKIKFTVATNVELSKPKVFCVKSRVGQTGILPAARSSVILPGWFILLHFSWSSCMCSMGNM